MINCENECNLPSSDNELKVLFCALRRELDGFITDTEMKLIMHDGKIAESCQYLKNNLSNTIRCLLSDMKFSGELDNIISTILLNKCVYFENTVQDLKESGVQIGDLVITTGYYESNDGGAALYKIREWQENDTENGKLIFLKSNRVAELITGDTIYSKQFGVKGDGKADDTKSLQNFFDVAAKKYIINSGEILVSKDIELKNSNCEIEFENSKITRAKNNLDKYYVLNCYNVHDIVFKNLYIAGDRYVHQGSTGEWGHTLNIVDSYNIKVLDSKFENPWGDGIYIGYEWTLEPLNRAANIEVINSEIINPSRNGISICSGDGVTIKNVKIHGETRTGPNSGIDVEPEHSNTSVPHLSNVLIENVYTSTTAGIVYMLGNYNVNSLIIRNCISENETNSIIGFNSFGTSNILIENQLCKNVLQQAIVFHGHSQNTHVDLINPVIIDNQDTSSDVYVNAAVIINVSNFDVHNINIDGLKVKSNKRPFGSAFFIYSTSDKKIYNLKLKNVETDNLVYLHNAIDYATAEIKLNKTYVENYYQINVGGNNFFANEIVVPKTSAFDTVRKFDKLPDGDYVVKFLNKNSYSNYVDFTSYSNVYNEGVKASVKQIKSNGDQGIMKFTILNGDIYITEKIGTWVNM